MNKIAFLRRYLPGVSISITASMLLLLATGLTGCDAVTGPTVEAETFETTGSSANCMSGRQSSGALYEICTPDGDSPTRTLAVYAHGFVFPHNSIALPEEEAGINVRSFLTSQGFDYAATSYYTNGLVKPELAVKDLRELVTLYTQLHGRPERVLLFSVSNGALYGTLAIEKHPGLFDGAFAACAPVGDYRRQINYLADMLVLFQHFIPGVVPGGPDGIPASYVQGIISAADAAGVPPDLYLAGSLSDVLTAPANWRATAQLLSIIARTTEIGAVFETSPEGLNTLIRGIVYNVFATNNGLDVLGGAYFDNRNRTYVGSADDAALNGTIRRYGADANAVAQIEGHFQTKGMLAAPVIALHTRRDPTVPFWHGALYQSKLGPDASLHTLTPIDRYGHCAFTPQEIQAGMDELMVQVEAPAVAIY